MPDDLAVSTCSNCNGRNACNMCGAYTCTPEHHKYVVLRWLLGLLILTITFCLGAKVGEFKSAYKHELFNYGYGGHGAVRALPPMMYFQGKDVLTTPGVPETQTPSVQTQTKLDTLPKPKN